MAPGLSGLSGAAVDRRPARAGGALCLQRTNDPYALRLELAGRTVTLAWDDRFQGEKRWEVEQLQRSGKYKRVRVLPANATGVAIPGQKPGTTAFRVRAQIGRDFAEYSAVVEIAIP